ncbi:FCD domain-containing protein [Roseibium salinum]|nr:FCD domain-containing protein [Roseibium salinum]
MKLQAMDISATASASSIVFDALRKAIIEGRIEEGEPLRQDEIARLFQHQPHSRPGSDFPSGRTGPRQDAALQGRGGRRTVAAANAGDFRSARADRTGNHPQCGAQHECGATGEGTGEMRGFFSASPDPMTWGDLNRDFHETLYSSSTLKFFMEIADNAIDRVERQIRAQLVMSNGMERAGREHFAILEACEKGDADLAARLTRDHILGAKKRPSWNTSFHVKTARSDKPFAQKNKPARKFMRAGF